MITVPRYNLVGPRDRLYTFAPLSTGMIRVRRWEGEKMQSERILGKDPARKLWDYLIKTHGYRRV